MKKDYNISIYFLDSTTLDIMFSGTESELTHWIQNLSRTGFYRNGEYAQRYYTGQGIKCIKYYEVVKDEDGL